MTDLKNSLIIVPGSDPDLYLDLENPYNRPEVSFTNSKEALISIEVNSNSKNLQILPLNKFDLNSWETKIVRIGMTEHERLSLLNALKTFSSTAKKVIDIGKKNKEQDEENDVENHVRQIINNSENVRVSVHASTLSSSSTTTTTVELVKSYNIRYLSPLGIDSINSNSNSSVGIHEEEMKSSTSYDTHTCEIEEYKSPVTNVNVTFSNDKDSIDYLNVDTPISNSSSSSRRIMSYEDAQFIASEYALDEEECKLDPSLDRWHSSPGIAGNGAAHSWMLAVNFHSTKSTRRSFNQLLAKSRSKRIILNSFYRNYNKRRSLFTLRMYAKRSIANRMYRYFIGRWIFQRWKKYLQELNGTPFSRGIAVWALVKWTSLTLGTLPKTYQSVTYSDGYRGDWSEVDLEVMIGDEDQPQLQYALQTVLVRGRSYMQGRMIQHPRHIPIYAHAIGLMDGYLIRQCLNGWFQWTKLSIHVRVFIQYRRVRRYLGHWMMRVGLHRFSNRTPTIATLHSPDAWIIIRKARAIKKLMLNWLGSRTRRFVLHHGIQGFSRPSKGFARLVQLIPKNLLELHEPLSNTGKNGKQIPLEVRIIRFLRKKYRLSVETLNLLYEKASNGYSLPRKLMGLRVLKVHAVKHPKYRHDLKFAQAFHRGWLLRIAIDSMLRLRMQTLRRRLVDSHYRKTMMKKALKSIHFLRKWQRRKTFLHRAHNRCVALCFRYQQRLPLSIWYKEMNKQIESRFIEQSLLDRAVLVRQNRNRNTLSTVFSLWLTIVSEHIRIRKIKSHAGRARAIALSTSALEERQRLWRLARHVTVAVIVQAWWRGVRCRQLTHLWIQKSLKAAKKLEPIAQRRDVRMQRGVLYTWLHSVADSKRDFRSKRARLLTKRLFTRWLLRVKRSNNQVKLIINHANRKGRIGDDRVAAHDEVNASFRVLIHHYWMRWRSACDEGWQNQQQLDSAHKHFQEQHSYSITSDMRIDRRIRRLADSAPSIYSSPEKDDAAWERYRYSRLRSQNASPPSRSSNRISRIGSITGGSNRREERKESNRLLSPTSWRRRNIVNADNQLKAKVDGNSYSNSNYVRSRSSRSHSNTHTKKSSNTSSQSRNHATSSSHVNSNTHTSSHYGGGSGSRRPTSGGSPGGGDDDDDDDDDNSSWFNSEPDDFYPSVRPRDYEYELSNEAARRAITRWRRWVWSRRGSTASQTKSSRREILSYMEQNRSHRFNNFHSPPGSRQVGWVQALDDDTADNAPLLSSYTAPTNTPTPRRVGLSMQHLSDLPSYSTSKHFSTKREPYQSQHHGRGMVDSHHMTTSAASLSHVEPRRDISMGDAESHAIAHERSLLVGKAFHVLKQRAIRRIYAKATDNYVSVHSMENVRILSHDNINLRLRRMMVVAKDIRLRKSHVALKLWSQWLSIVQQERIKDEEREHRGVQLRAILFLRRFKKRLKYLRYDRQNRYYIEIRRKSRACRSLLKSLFEKYKRRFRSIKGRNQAIKVAAKALIRDWERRTHQLGHHEYNDQKSKDMRRNRQLFTALKRFYHLMRLRRRIKRHERAATINTSVRHGRMALDVLRAFRRRRRQLYHFDNKSFDSCRLRVLEVLMVRRRRSRRAASYKNVTTNVKKSILSTMSYINSRSFFRKLRPRVFNRCIKLYSSHALRHSLQNLQLNRRFHKILYRQYGTASGWRHRRLRKQAVHTLYYHTRMRKAIRKIRKRFELRRVMEVWGRKCHIEWFHRRALKTQLARSRLRCLKLHLHGWSYLTQRTIFLNSAFTVVKRYRHRLELSKRIHFWRWAARQQVELRKTLKVHEIQRRAIMMRALHVIRNQRKFVRSERKRRKRWGLRRLYRLLSESQWRYLEKIDGDSYYRSYTLQIAFRKFYALAIRRKRINNRLVHNHYSYGHKKLWQFHQNVRRLHTNQKKAIAKGVTHFRLHHLSIYFNIYREWTHARLYGADSPPQFRSEYPYIPFGIDTRASMHYKEMKHTIMRKRLLEWKEDAHNSRMSIYYQCMGNWRKFIYAQQRAREAAVKHLLEIGPLWRRWRFFNILKKLRIYARLSDEIIDNNLVWIQRRAIRTISRTYDERMNKYMELKDTKIYKTMEFVLHMCTRKLAYAINIWRIKIHHAENIYKEWVLKGSLKRWRALSVMFKKRRATQVKITFEAWIIYKKGKRLWRRLICRRWFKAWAALPRCSKVGFRQYEGVRHFVRLLERWHERYQRACVRHGFAAMARLVHMTPYFDKELYYSRVETRHRNEAIHKHGHGAGKHLWFLDDGHAEEQVQEVKMIQEIQSNETAHETKMRIEKEKIQKLLKSHMNGRSDDDEDENFLGFDDEVEGDDEGNGSGNNTGPNIQKFNGKWQSIIQKQRKFEKSRGGYNAHAHSGFGLRVEQFVQRQNFQ